MVAELPIDPMRLCCGQRHHGAVCPDGKVMCCLCFNRVPTDDLYVDSDGDRWDICKECERYEKERSSTTNPSLSKTTVATEVSMQPLGRTVM